MTASSSGAARQAAALAAELVGQMIRQWRQGERPVVEDFLARHPMLWEHPLAAADLIYEELCLREEYGPPMAVEEVLRRFPQWRPQLEVLLDCQRVLGPRAAPPRYPAAGEVLGDFRLLAELGSGSHGRVFLARQLSLGGRPVVLKVTPREAAEHLALARLQHTHIVPLYSAEEYPDRGLRALCMPYFGGATLAHLLEALAPQPPARRTGQDLLAALDRAPAAALPAAPPRGPLRTALAGASYVRAVCWVGACLADALQYAHERGLVHLDLKPSNVLLADDGTPMLLDFHLAREPIPPGATGPQPLGGTAGYFSPEQEAALAAVRQGREVPAAVDGRSDVYSLGVVLYEALGGGLPRGGRPELLARRNAQVSVGLADVVGKCLARDPGDRYPHMAALADDLRRHLADRPLAGVRNRSLAERWRKWRRRRPYRIALLGMMLAVVTAAGAVAVAAAAHFGQRAEQARAALNAGQAQLDRGEWEAAVCTLRRGQALARGLPWQRDLAEELDRRRRVAERAWTARQLHELADRVRFLYGVGPLPPQRLGELGSRCRTLWETRGTIVQRLSPAGPAGLDPVARDDLLDLAICWAGLQSSLAAPGEKEEARRKALAVLAEAEDLFGPSPVLDAERCLYGAPSRPAPCRPGLTGADTAWAHYALGRALLRSGNLERAEKETALAVRLQPQGLWPNFYHGLCLYRRGRPADAALAFSVCVGAAPAAAACFYNRALALAALGRDEEARQDYDEALRLDPTLAAAALNRGLLHGRAGRYAAARADLLHAAELGADPAVVTAALARLGQNRPAGVEQSAPGSGAPSP